MCRTANDNAIHDIEEPAVLIVSPKKNRRKFVCCSTPKRLDAISDPRT